ncbi:hypothetical protein JKF63_00852 [Porcisia hertigi]|uniref:TRUD domain-containing protein n=1 Tax=Porcisia hertigi TaxID=2761500 RepID=A0A836L1F4_9TRYP|nr:hypothetical protein JKF63_00852 [Porcisia hertigi]
MNVDQLANFLARVASQHSVREESIGATRRIVELYRHDATDGIPLSLPIVSLKTLYTDFEVRELPAFYGNGAPLVLELDCTVAAKSEDASAQDGISVSSPKRSREEQEVGGGATGTLKAVETNSSAASSTVAKLIGPLISAEDLSHLLIGLADAAKSIALPSVTDKEKRAELHKAIKACLGSTHVSNTVDGVVTIIKANAADRREERRRSRTNSTVQKYHHFTLYKENIDSNQALRMLAHHLKLSSRQLQFCGTKDKRAVTLQRVAIRETTVERIQTVNSRTFGAHNVIKVCGFTEEDHGLRLGDTLGNQFRIVLRVFPTPRSATESGTSMCQTLSAEHLHDVERIVRDVGVINYFGPQRFGTTDVLTSDVGIQFLKGRLREGLRLMLLSKSCMVPEMQRIVKLFDASDYTAALQATPYYCYQERDLLKHLSTNPNDYLGSLQAIARTMAMMYFHAVQSLVWNRLASSRLSSASRMRPEVGDLVLELTYLARLAGKDPQPREIPEGTKLPATRRLENEDDCKYFGLVDVMLPVPGPDPDLSYPSSRGCTRDDYDAVLAELGINFSSKEALALKKVFHFHGTYRALGVQPKDFTLRVETVPSWRTPVLKSDWEKHRDAVGIVAPALHPVNQTASVTEPAGPVQAVVAVFSLPPGSYATSVLREFCIPVTESFQEKDSGAEDG